jgi:hypothetical protein
MVREGWKCSESVGRGSSIGHKCWNMHPEPGVAHQHVHVCPSANLFFKRIFPYFLEARSIVWTPNRPEPMQNHFSGQKWSKTQIFSPDMPQQILANSDLHLPSTIIAELNLERMEGVVWTCVVQQGGEEEEEELADEIQESDCLAIDSSGSECATEQAEKMKQFTVREQVVSGVYMEG